MLLVPVTCFPLPGELNLFDFLVQCHFAHQLRNEFIHLLQLPWDVFSLGVAVTVSSRESQGY